MKNKAINVLIAVFLTSFTSCSQNSTAVASDDSENQATVKATVQPEPHRYGGWYCPDNLNGFPPVNISDWKNVPVINGRLATKEETQTEASLIFVDVEKYPKAKTLDMTMPKLATTFNYSTNREEYIILIQGLNIDNDSIVGFRYLNGGNGSARLSDVKLLSNTEINTVTTSKFVTLNIDIAAVPTKVWEVLTKNESTKVLQPIFDKNNTIKAGWKATSNVNFKYPNAGLLMAGFADMLYGSYYIQNDYSYLNYSEKFFLAENQESRHTELKIVCGPFATDYEAQKAILTEWAQKVKILSEIK
jgi:hypothetical protein